MDISMQKWKTWLFFIPFPNPSSFQSDSFEYNIYILYKGMDSLQTVIDKLKVCLDLDVLECRFSA